MVSDRNTEPTFAPIMDTLNQVMGSLNKAFHLDCTVPHYISIGDWVFHSDKFRKVTAISKSSRGWMMAFEGHGVIAEVSDSPRPTLKKRPPIHEGAASLD